MTGCAGDFASRVVAWQARHGRSGLPWQGTRDPYRVWLSETMLQQTQVATVLGYYERFTSRFPDVQALAAAPADEVMALWSGLGYYSRARNLHACARQVVSEHGGRFPVSAQQLQTLPGIGPSTAAAIAAFCFGERAAILDGNVKRVLTRLLAFDHDISSSAHQRKLWQHAQELLPGEPGAMPSYTQGLMDLGATVCTTRRPQCLLCPVSDACAARRQGEPERYPVKGRRVRRTAQSLWLLKASSPDGAVWLHRRPEQGVWAGLYCLPAFASLEELQQALPGQAQVCEEPPLLHVLTHKDLHLHPVTVRTTREPLAGEGGWFDADHWPRLGLPAPIRTLLQGRG
ncbi:A/G-specific adenine glycosylase [Ramlibacter sp. AW1]|uniref:Adenine DNA glycosylase n=1 Tax=Ramlibacter aurantiacus TaxID=2801330 RepID=A0A936ZX22_9BURK|nr:A/G-specific adenine glycosylase [Ramlibacter aurantiacus]MBL0422099.1 A/G-specific adenine glycosylase [Ramlibacter aurantiacus]